MPFRNRIDETGHQSEVGKVDGEELTSGLDRRQGRQGCSLGSGIKEEESL